jgi:quinoprotein glucose dehydrogenase
VKLALILLSIASLSFAAEPNIEAGKKAEATYCVACHSARLIDSQRLSAAAWTKEVDKMIGWGAIVPDKQLLIDFLAVEYSNAKPLPIPAVSADGTRRKN